MNLQSKPEARAAGLVHLPPNGLHGPDSQPNRHLDSKSHGVAQAGGGTRPLTTQRKILSLPSKSPSPGDLGGLSVVQNLQRIHRRAADIALGLEDRFSCMAATAVEPAERAELTTAAGTFRVLAVASLAVAGGAA